MKRLVYVLLVSVFLLGNTSCSFLDVSPQGALDEDDILNNASDVKMYLTGCYDILGGSSGRALETAWILGNMCSDDSWKGGEGSGDFAGYTELIYFYGGTNNTYIENAWNAYWIGIYRCNYLLSKGPGVKMDEDLKARYLAEARFLRAFYYFELVKYFGDLPKITVPIAPKDVNHPRVNKSIIYDELIEADLKAVIDILPQKSEYDQSKDAGRATRGAALALLTKVYLYQQEWLEAYQTAELVISEGEYQLEKDFRNNFEVDNPNGVESIFENQQSGDQTYDEGSCLPVMCRSRNDNGYGLDKPSSSLYYEFETGDPRLQLTITLNNDTVEGKPYPIDGPSTWSMSYKYYIPKAKRANIEWNRSPYNTKLIRYADLLLMYAEAANELGITGDALNALEMVRKRARNMSSNREILPEVTTTDVSELRDAIRHERRVELAMEFHRFFDIVRWGIAKETLNAFVLHNCVGEAWAGEKDDIKGGWFQEGKHELFAIPGKDCEVAGWENNPGY